MFTRRLFLRAMSAAAAGAMLGAARFLPLPRLPEPAAEPDEASSAWTVTMGDTAVLLPYVGHGVIVMPPGFEPPGGVWEKTCSTSAEFNAAIRHARELSRIFGWPIRGA